ncbi:MAG: hypothetical protein Q7U92_10440 [Bradyrhizobium sp.]|nr:hypothetical protein [Bradyrhizobium sp.]
MAGFALAGRHINMAYSLGNVANVNALHAEVTAIPSEVDMFRKPIFVLTVAATLGGMSCAAMAQVQQQAPAGPASERP